MHILNIYYAYIVYFIYILLFQIKMAKSPNKNVKRLNVKQKRTLVQLSVAQKQSKERLSVAVIVNASGDEFIKPIGHHRKPRCFKDTYWHNYIIENY